MKTLTFTYTKKDGSVSSRTLLAMVTPGDKYAGIDVSGLDADTAQDFINGMECLYNDYLVQMERIKAAFDLKHNYRQFDADKMSAITQI